MFSVKKGNLFILMFLIVFIFFTNVFAVLLSAAGLLEHTLLLVGVIQVFLIFLPVVFYLLLTKAPAKEVLMLRRPKWYNVLLAVFIAFFSMPIVALINIVSQLFVSSPIENTLADIINQPYLLSLFVIAVFPAIFEELLTRGIFIAHYRNKTIFVTSLMSGLVFGIIHLNINQFLYAFVLGFLFSVVNHLSGSIIPSMVMHFLINGLNVSIQYLFSVVPNQQDLIEGLDKEAIMIASLPSYVIAALVCLPIVGVLLYIMLLQNQKAGLITGKRPSYEYFGSTALNTPAATEDLSSASHRFRTYIPVASDSDLSSSAFSTSFNPNNSENPELPPASLSRSYEPLSDLDLASNSNLSASTDSLNSQPITEPTIDHFDDASPQPPTTVPKERIFTIPLIITIIIFLAFSILTEVLARLGQA